MDMLDKLNRFIMLDHSPFPFGRGTDKHSKES